MIAPAGVATIVDLAVAGLVGLAVGIEREWSGHASGPGERAWLTQSQDVAADESGAAPQKKP